MPCRIQRTQQWAVRLQHENTYHEESSFVTLTYDDDHLPADGRISKKELQNFIKRLRKSTSAKLKYYGCGEYGERTFRPHYHLIIFGLNDRLLIEQNWTKGLVYVGTVTMDSCRYVASYVQKKLYKNDKDDPFKLNQDLFSIMSQGMGLSWAKDNKSYLQENQKVTVKGTPIGIPRYYVQKLELDLSETVAGNQKQKDEEYARLLATVQSDTSALYEVNMQSKVQRRKNVEAKTSLKQKKL